MKKQILPKGLLVMLTSGAHGFFVFTGAFAILFYALRTYGLFLAGAHVLWGLALASFLGLSITYLLDPRRARRLGADE